MRTFNNVAKLLAVVLMLCICNTASAATNFVLVPTANSPSAHQPVGVIGSDGFLYVGVDGWLFKIDPNSQEVVWKSNLFVPNVTGSMPTGICFVGSSQIVVSIGPNQNGAVPNNSWGVVILSVTDGSVVSTAPFPGGTGGGGCAVTSSQQDLLFSNTVGMGYAETDLVKTRRPDIAAYTPFTGITQAPIPYLTTKNDGTVVGTVQINATHGVNTTGSFFTVDPNGQYQEHPVNFTPRSRPVINGDKVLFSGNNWYGATAPADSFFGLGTYNLADGTQTTFIPNFAPQDVAFNKSSGLYYTLWGGYVQVFDTTSKPGSVYNYQFYNPDGSNGNVQMFVKSGLNEDTVIVLQQNGNVLFWNVPRNPCATGVANSTGPLTLTRNSFGSIYGCGNLAADVTTPDAAWQTNQLATGQSVFPNTLGNVQVKVCGELAPLSYANPMQVNFQVPADIPNGSCPVDVQTLNDDGSINRNYSGSLYIPIKPTSVGIFVVTHGVPTAGGYQLPTVGNPAVAGETLTIWSNGLGDVTEPVQTGVPAPSNRLVRTLAQPTVTIGGLNASVQFSGLAPSLSGAYQVNVQVPANLPSGPQTLKICMGDDCASVVLNQ